MGVGHSLVGCVARHLAPVQSAKGLKLDRDAIAGTSRTGVVVQAQQMGLLRPPTNEAGEVVGGAVRADAFLRFTPLPDILLMKRGVA